MTTASTILLGAVRLVEDTEIDESTVTPGVLGFVITAAFILAVMLLGADLVRRVRRNHYRDEIRQELEAELAEREAQEGQAESPADPPSPADGADDARPGNADRSGAEG